MDEHLYNYFYDIDTVREIPRLPGIYLLLCLINGKIYVGKANNLRERIQHHKYSEKSSKNENTYAIENAIKFHGWHNFVIIILECFDIGEILNNELLLLESRWINILNATNRKKGYNICIYSNDCTGMKRTEQTKLKLFNAHKGKHAGAKNGMFGKRHSEESKKKMSEAQLGEKGVFYGKHHTQETIEKIRAKNKLQDRDCVRKKIKQIDPGTNEIIKIWNSLTEAAKSLKTFTSNITVACQIRNKNGSPRLVRGFQWEYVN